MGQFFSTLTQIKKRILSSKYEEHLIEVQECSSWAEFVILAVLAVATVVFCGIWSFYFNFAQYDLHANDTFVAFNYHIVFNGVFHILLPGISCMLFRLVCIWKYNILKCIHAILFVPGLVAIFPSIYFVFVYRNKTDYPLPMFYGLHGVFGILYYVLYVVTVLLSVPLLCKKNLTKWYLPLHQRMGIIVYLSCGMAFASGLYQACLAQKTEIYQESRNIYYADNFAQFLFMLCPILVVILVGSETFQHTEPSIVMPDEAT